MGAPAPGNGGTNEGAATLKPTKCHRVLTHNSRAGIPKRNVPQLPQYGGKLKSAWVASLLEVAERPRTLASRRHLFLQVVVASSGSRQAMAAIPFRFPSTSLLGLLLSHSSLAGVRCPSRQKRRTHGLTDSYIHTVIQSYIHTVGVFSVRVQ